MFDFPEKIENLSDVPDAFQSLYAEEEGGFQLNGELAAQLDKEPLLQEITDLKSEADTLAGQLQQSRLEIEKIEQARLMDQAEKEIRNTVTLAGGSADLLLPHILAKATVTQGEEGAVLLFSEKEGKTQNLDSVLEEMKQNPHLAPAFKQSRPTGSGMPPSSSAGLYTQISRQDQQAVNAHIEEIATGKISVRD